MLGYLSRLTKSFSYQSANKSSTNLIACSFIRFLTISGSEPKFISRFLIAASALASANDKSGYYPRVISFLLPFDE